VYDRDWQMMPFAMAAGSSATLEESGWRLEAPATLLFRTGGDDAGWLLDGQPWAAYNDSGVVIPAGLHTLRHSETAKRTDILRLVSINGELLDVQADEKKASVRYFSRPRCALGFSRAIVRTLVDGIPTELPVTRTDEGSVVLAPPGTHRLTALAD
jgi:hypothetical protein